VSKKRKAIEERLKDNPLYLDYNNSPADYYGGARDYIAIFDPNFNAVVLFPKAFSKDEFDDSTIAEIITVIIHETLHQAIYHTITAKERTARFIRYEEQLVELLETVSSRGEKD